MELEVRWEVSVEVTDRRRLQLDDWLRWRMALLMLIVLLVLLRRHSMRLLPLRLLLVLRRRRGRRTMWRVLVLNWGWCLSLVQSLFQSLLSLVLRLRLKGSGSRSVCR